VGVALTDRPASPIGSQAVAGEYVPDSGVAAPGTPPSPRAADSRTKVLDAALRCVARFGVGKTKVDDIAREARLSRATLYRLFPGGRDEVVKSMADREIRRFFSQLAGRLRSVEDIEERIVIAMVSAGDAIATNEALGYVMANEPELLLPHVSFAELDQLLELASSFFAPYLSGVLGPEDARRVGEWITRLVLSHVGCPGSAIDAAWDEPRANTAAGSGGSPFAVHPGALAEDRARWLVRHFVMPGIRSLRSKDKDANSRDNQDNRDMTTRDMTTRDMTTRDMTTASNDNSPARA
jgi:AcrR family transcriptional regulator